MERDQFFTKLRNTKAGINCPCCGRYAKVYKRPIDATTATLLIEAYRRFDLNTFHINELVHEKKPATGFSVLRYWGLVEFSKNPDPFDKHTTGFWKVTERGKRWVKQEVKIPKYRLLFDNTVLGTEGPHIGLFEVPKFNKEELLNDTL